MNVDSRPVRFFLDAAENGRVKFVIRGVAYAAKPTSEFRYQGGDTANRKGQPVVVRWRVGGRIYQASITSWLESDEVEVVDGGDF